MAVIENLDDGEKAPPPAPPHCGGEGPGEGLPSARDASGGPEQRLLDQQLVFGGAVRGLVAAQDNDFSQSCCGNFAPDSMISSISAW